MKNRRFAWARLASSVFCLTVGWSSALAADKISLREPTLRAHLSFLADDLLEGRGTGQRGGDLAVRYLATQAEMLGLKSLNPDPQNAYLHSIRIIGAKTLSSSKIEFDYQNKSFTPKLNDDIVMGASNGQSLVDFSAPMVFVGYGISAPDENWDDYKGVDVSGKLVIMMVNDPQPTAAQPNRFGGKAMTYYGRWRYKFEEAVRRGVAGVLLVHTDASAAYGWHVPRAGFTKERFQLGPKGNPLEGWWAEASLKKFLGNLGMDLDQMRARAEKTDFVPIDIPAQAKVHIESAVREIEQFNVAGYVPGTDPHLKHEAVVYSAHWDHLGINQEAGQKPQIWNGAVDNASGSAALLAMAEYAVKHPSKRAQIFLWPAAEEQGLIGSQAWVQEPPWPLKQQVADLNLDSMNFAGKTKDIGVAGAERSSLYDSAQQIAKQMGLKIAPPVPDLGGAFFRADHFNFVRAGVPGFNVGSAVFSGDGHFEFQHDHSQQSTKMKGYKNDYHTPRDRYDAKWDLSGMLQQAEFTLRLGYLVANSNERPVWKNKPKK